MPDRLDFEIFLNRKFDLRNRPITVVALPTTSDEARRAATSTIAPEVKRPAPTP